MQQVTITFSGSDNSELKNLKQLLSRKHPEIRVQKANLEIIPGAIDTLSILGVTISVNSDVVPKVVSTWLYDLLKKMSPDAKIALHVNGVKVSTQEEIERVLEKQVAREKKGSKGNQK